MENNSQISGQPGNVTPEAERWILYDRKHSRVENTHRVFQGHATIPGVCRVCGDTFLSASRQTRYCSGRCANDAAIEARRIAKGNQRQGILCCVCGSKIETGSSGRLPKYCSNACRQRQYRNLSRLKKRPLNAQAEG